MATTGNHTQHEQNAVLRNEYKTLEKLRAELLDSDPQSRQAARLQRKMDRIANEFAWENRGLAGTVAKTFAVGPNAAQDSEEYYAAGMMGLWEAFRIWDPEQAKFGFFSRIYIEGAVKRAVRNAEAAEISYGDFSQRPKVTQAIKAIDAQGGDATNLDRIAEEAGVSRSIAERVTMQRPTSLDVQVGDEMTLGDVVAKTTVDFDGEEIDVDLLAETLDSLHLPAVDNWVAIRRYGLDGATPQNQISIARSIGYGRQSLQRVAQRVDTAFGKAAAESREQKVASIA